MAHWYYIWTDGWPVLRWLAFVAVMLVVAGIYAWFTS